MIRKYIMQIGAKKTMAIVIGVIAILVGMLIVAGLVPVLQEYVMQKKARYAAEEKSAGISVKNNELDTLAGEIERLKGKIQTRVTDLPARYLQSFLIGSLQEISWRNNIELISVTPGDAERVDQFDEISFVVDIKGRFRKMYSWLSDLEKSIGFVVIEDYGINRTSSTAGSNLLQMNLTMTFYRYTQS